MACFTNLRGRGLAAMRPAKIKRPLNCRERARARLSAIPLVAPRLQADTESAARREARRWPSTS
jgi:hypothetical protein